MDLIDQVKKAQIIYQIAAEISDNDENNLKYLPYYQNFINETIHCDYFQFLSALINCPLRIDKCAGILGKLSENDANFLRKQKDFIEQKLYNINLLLDM